MDPIEHLNISEYLQEASIQVSADKLEKLQRFHIMLRKENERINVTRLYGASAMGRKHYVDSLLPEKLLRQAQLDLRSPCMDLGSGGGFPGIPLAIVRPDIHFRLVEGRKKRTEFLSSVVAELKLPNVEVISRKLNPADRIECNSAISRAFMTIPDTLRLSTASVNPDGLFVFWKGPDCDDEILEAGSVEGWSHLKTLDYTLPGTQDRRRLVLFQRFSAGIGSPVSGNEVRIAGPGQSTQDEGSGSDTKAEIGLSDKHGIPAWLQGRVRVLESESNPRFKDWSRLDQSKWIRKTGLTLVAGRKIVPELLQEMSGGADPRPEFARPRTTNVESESSQRMTQAHYNGQPEALIFHDTLPEEFFSILGAWPDLPLYRLRGELFRKLDFSGTRYPLLLWNLEDSADFADLPEWDSYQNPQEVGRPSSILVLPLSLPENMGSAIRTARGFGVDSVLITAESVFPFHPLAIRSSSGACLRTKFFQTGPLNELSRKLKAAHYPERNIVVLDHRSNVSLQALRPSIADVSQPVLFVVGQEGQGLPENLQGQRFRIPISGLESLNAVISLTALLYEWRRSD
ncbi:MAG: 16S rRNA (guanine(527)-N(7))-methyltransferase RsmG [Leptospiraceae bacterium]